MDKKQPPVIVDTRTNCLVGFCRVRTTKMQVRQHIRRRRSASKSFVVNIRYYLFYPFNANSKSKYPNKTRSLFYVMLISTDEGFISSFFSIDTESVNFDHHLRCGGWLNFEFSKREKHLGWAIKTIYKKLCRGMLKHIPLKQ